MSSKISAIGDKQMKAIREIYQIYNHNINHGNRFQMEWLRFVIKFSAGCIFETLGYKTRCHITDVVILFATTFSYQ